MDVPKIPGYETDSWRYIPAHPSKVHDRPDGVIRRIVVHCTTGSDHGDRAIATANYFAKPISESSVGSAHVTVDGGRDEPHIVQSVWDSKRANGAAGDNYRTLHLEISGSPHQSRSQWLDAYGKRMMPRAADVVAQWACKYGIPLRWLRVDQLRANQWGLVTHVDVRDAFGQTSHWDPGPHFPKDVLIAQSRERAREILVAEGIWTPPKPKPEPPDDITGKSYVVKSGDTLADIASRWKGVPSVERLAEWNNIPNPNVVEVGTRLYRVWDFNVAVLSNSDADDGAASVMAGLLGLAHFVDKIPAGATVRTGIRVGAAASTQGFRGPQDHGMKYWLDLAGGNRRETWQLCEDAAKAGRDYFDVLY